MWLPMKPAPPVTKIFISNGLHQFVHGRFLLLYGLDQFELCATAVKVVSFAVDFEIGVARQKIGEETNAVFKRDEFARKSEKLLFRSCQKLGSRCEIAAQQRIEHWKLHLHF